MKIPRHKRALFQRVKSSEAGICVDIFLIVHPYSSFFRTIWAAWIEALYCSDTTKTQKICQPWTSEWPKLCNKTYAEQIIGPADAAFPLQFCELSLHQPHKTSCRKHLCEISPKSVFYTFPLVLLPGHYLRSRWCKVNGNARSMWDHAVWLKTGFKSTRHPFYSKDAQRTEKNRDGERKHHKPVWFAHRAGHGLSATGDQNSPEHQWLRVRSIHVSGADCSRRTEQQHSAAEQQLSSGGATPQINLHTSLFDCIHSEPLCRF